MKIIVTGATGMVGEGVLLECLQNKEVSQVLIIGRKHYAITHPKLTELIVPDFMKLRDYIDSVKGYDACFYCAGVSSVGMKEEKYTRITYDTTLAFAEALLEANEKINFCYVTGSHTDGTETGKVMWARVKGKTENALMRMNFGSVYNFRPGFMEPFPGQKNVPFVFRFFGFFFPRLFPKQSLTLKEVGLAMIYAVSKGYPKQVLEIRDIRLLSRAIKS